MQLVAIHRIKSADRFKYLTFALLIIVISIFVTTLIGYANINISEATSILLNKIGLSKQVNFTASQSIILWNYRLPRIFMALIVGGGLAIAGAALQGLMRNPLVEPGLIGVSSGAAFFAVLIFVLGKKLPAEFQQLQMYLLPVAAFAGSFLVTFFVYQLSKVNGNSNVAFLILAGIAINALCNALIGLTLYFADDEAIRNFTFWTMGNLSGADWKKLPIALLLILTPSIVLVRYHKVLDALNIGEEVAEQLGAQVNRSKTAIITLSALIVGTAVSLTGIIGFIGLVVPHLIRMLIGSKQSYVLVGSILLGGIALLIADTFGRVVVAPAELPIGIITALVSTPFFLWLLLKVKKQLLF